ncbi:hypothetical protein TNCV_1684631 [Trichonephila clavipes]|nr:hypothetical protein TNCV_1684631 [Trichonephila clavipes]
MEKHLQGLRFVSSDGGKHHRCWPYGRLQKRATSYASRSYMNAGRSVSSLKEDYFKDEYASLLYLVLHSGYGFLHLVPILLDHTTYNEPPLQLSTFHNLSDYRLGFHIVLRVKL